MRGGTEPPCCDFFEYNIRALAHELPMADFDEDDEVGARDLARWVQGFGVPAIPVGAGLPQGDGDGDGDVDGSDFLAWQRQQGQAPPVLDVLDKMVDAALASAQITSTAGIPEPGSLALLVVGSLAVGGRRRARTGCSSCVHRDATRHRLAGAVSASCAERHRYDAG
jgi:hypothetical protein